LQAELGTDFTTTQLNQLIASWVRAPSGTQGFAGILSLPGLPPVVSSSTESLDLPALGAAFFQPSVSPVDYPGTEGPHIVYAGIDGDDAVDLEAPFEVDDGALIVYNANFDLDDPDPEHSGPDLLPGASKHLPPSIPPDIAARIVGRNPAWLHPPPVRPDRHESLRRWQRATRALPLP